MRYFNKKKQFKQNKKVRKVVLLTSGSVFSDVSKVDALREEGCVVVDVLEVDLNVRVADKALAALVLCEHGEAPLRPTARLVSVQRL